MEFLSGICRPEDMMFFGVGEYAVAFLGDGYEMIHSEEDIDGCEQSACVCLVADGESLPDIALLDRVLDRCKAQEVFVIIANPAPPELIKALKHKCSCILTIDKEDAAEATVPLMNLIARICTCPHLLDLDTAELRALFDPARTVAHHTLWYEDIDPQAFARDVNTLELDRHKWPTLVCVFLTAQDDWMELGDLLAPLLAFMPEEGHHPLVWNVYHADQMEATGMRIDIVRSRPAPGTMQMLREINKQIH